MIFYYTSMLIIAGVIIVALASIAIIVIRRNSRLERDKQSLQRAVQEAQRSAATWSEEATRLEQVNLDLKARDADLSEALERTRVLYNKVLQENAALNARNTALVEAMEARPTQPKRTVRKNATQAHQQFEVSPLTGQVIRQISDEGEHTP